MAIVFMGTPHFAVPTLRALVQAGYEIAALYTQPDKPAGRGRKPRPPPAKLAARELDLPVYQPPSLRSQDTLDELAALKPQAIVVCAYGHILRQAVLDIPPRGVLNVHPSLLPRHRGASPIAAALLAGDQETGVTVILMDAGMDSGPILAQRSLAITPFDTTATLSERLSSLAAQITVEALGRWLAGDIQPQPQDDSLATIAPLLRKEHGAIDWSLPAVDIWRRVRAYNPWPGAHTALDGEWLHIWEAWPLEADGSTPEGPTGLPGTVVALSADQLRQLPPQLPPTTFGVQTGRGLLAVLVAQRAGRRALPADQFLRGQPGLISRRLVTPASQ